MYITVCGSTCIDLSNFHGALLKWQEQGSTNLSHRCLKAPRSTMNMPWSLGSVNSPKYAQPPWKYPHLQNLSPLQYLSTSSFKKSLSNLVSQNHFAPVCDHARNVIAIRFISSSWISVSHLEHYYNGRISKKSFHALFGLCRLFNS